PHVGRERHGHARLARADARVDAGRALRPSALHDGDRAPASTRRAVRQPCRRRLGGDPGALPVPRDQRQLPRRHTRRRRRCPPRLLVVSAPDPMWHGGLSGEDSFFVNGHIPLRSADKTSTYLHELFHVWQPFRPGPDGHWIAEGLAEYYSLALPHRAGRLSDP